MTTTMTPEQKRLVRQTWDQVVPMAEAATEMVAQRKKLLQTLSFAINGLDDFDGVASKVEDLGRRHAGYGVTDAQYDSVGAALLWTLEQGLGRAWTPAVASAWTEVYAMLSGIMRTAAAR